MRVLNFKLFLLQSVLLCSAFISQAQENRLSLLVLPFPDRFSQNIDSESGVLASSKQLCSQDTESHSYREPLYKNRLINQSWSASQLKSGKEDEGSSSIFGMYIYTSYGKLRYNIKSTPAYQFDYVFTKGGGISLEIPLQTLNEKFSVYNELGFSQFKTSTSYHSGDTVGGDPVNNYYDVELTFAPNTLTLSNIVRYTLTPGEFKYYVALGIYNSFVVSSTNISETSHMKNGVAETSTGLAVPDPSVHGLMLLACTGFSYKNVGFELRFDPGRNYSNKLYYAVYMPSFNALLHVRFKPK